MENLVNNLEVYLNASIFMSLAAAFTGGLLTSFTPCVYPMIPITAGYVSSNNLGGSKLKGFWLSISYVLGVATTYASLGMIAAMTGNLFGQVSTNPWAYLIVANVIIFFGLGMLDVFQMPMVGKAISVKKKGGTGAFFMGIASGFLAAPCTAPVLGVLLAYVASTQNVIFGGSLLFVFALGMGLLLAIVGTFSGVMASLPKSGAWMGKIKKSLGIVMIFVGEYFLIKMGQLLF